MDEEEQSIIYPAFTYWPVWRKTGEPVIPGRLYVVSEKPDAPDHELVWTVSARPDAPGWETDSGYPGYGLPKAVAEAIACAFNDRASQWD